MDFCIFISRQLTSYASDQREGIVGVLFFLAKEQVNQKKVNIQVHPRRRQGMAKQLRRVQWQSAGGSQIIMYLILEKSY